jgi:hypothetical protein
MEIAENIPLLQIHTKSLKMPRTIIGKKTVSEILYFTGRNFLSQKETYCQGKTLRVTGRNLLSQ